MKSSALYIIAALFLALTSCRKDRSEIVNPLPESMEQLQVPSDFSWKTTLDYQLQITAASSGVLEVSNTANVIFQKAYLTPGQAYMMKLTVPAYEKTIKLKFMGQEVIKELNSPAFSYTFN